MNKAVERYQNSGLIHRNGRLVLKSEWEAGKVANTKRMIEILKERLETIKALGNPMLTRKLELEIKREESKIR